MRLKFIDRLPLLLTCILSVERSSTEVHIADTVRGVWSTFLRLLSLRRPFTPLPLSFSLFLSLSMQAASPLPSRQISPLFDVSYKTLMTGFTFYPLDVRRYLNVLAKTRSGRSRAKKLEKRRKDISILSLFLSLSRYNLCWAIIVVLMLLFYILKKYYLFK